MRRYRNKSLWLTGGHYSWGIMTEEKNGAFSVLAADEHLPDFTLMSKMISEARGMNLGDAGRAARHAWGFIGEGLSEAGADDLIQRCASYGVKALKVPVADLPAMKPVLYIKKAVFAGGVLNYSDPGANAGAAEKDDILVVAAAPVKEETSKTVKTTEGPSGQERAIRMGIMAVTGLPIGLGKTKEVQKEIKSSELSFYMDIILRADKTRATAVSEACLTDTAAPGCPGPKAGTTHLRLTSNDFDFSCLKEKKTYSSQLNFRLMCAELGAFAPHALKNSGLSAILESRPLGPLPYDTLADLEKETLRLAVLSLRI